MSKTVKIRVEPRALKDQPYFEVSEEHAQQIATSFPHMRVVTDSGVEYLPMPPVLAPEAVCARPGCNETRAQHNKKGYGPGLRACENVNNCHCLNFMTQTEWAIEEKGRMSRRFR